MRAPASTAPRCLTAGEERKLRSCLLLWLDNDKDGEALNARGASLRILNKAGIDPHTFVDRAIAGLVRMKAEASATSTASASMSWRDIAAACARQSGRLNPRESQFVCDMADKSMLYAPSRRQLEWLAAIFDKVEGGGNAARP